ncbi:MAG: hypothetical protein K2N06_12065 [Oscillospiraceae bacterium]|nr:hypothetical protein [Oscillospiraceae bacterium]
MKKTIKTVTAFLTLAAMLAFTACDKENANSDNSKAYSDLGTYDENTSSETKISPQGGVLAQRGALTMLHEPNCPGSLISGLGCRSSVCYTENGYYHMGPYRENDYNHLLYLDFATQQEVVVCSDSSCKHDTVNCASVFFDEYVFDNHLFVFQDYLYCLTTDYDQDGTMSSGGVFISDEVKEVNDEREAKRRASLYQMNLDGTERQRLWQSDAGDIAESEVFCDGTGFWFVTKTPSSVVHDETGAVYYHCKNRAFIRYDINERKITDRIPLEDYGNISLNVDGCTGSKFYLLGKAYPNGTSIMDNMDILAPSEEVGSTNPGWWDFNDKCECVYFTLDVKTKELKEITRYKIADVDYGAECRGGKIYFRRPNDSCFTYTIETGETAELNIPEGFRFEGFFADKLVLSHYFRNHDDRARYFADLDGSNITRSELLTNDGMDIELITVVGDNALVITGYDGIPSETSPGAFSCWTPLYALISLDDLFNGRANYKPFNMVNVP